MDNKLFPSHLNRGSKGPAVMFLQVLLIVQNFNRDIVPDGDYGDQTAKGVVELQKFLNDESGTKILELDGNFGQATRAEYKRYFDLDIDALPASIFAGTTQVV